MGAAAGAAVSGDAIARASFIGGVVALFGVVLSSSFGFLYLEWQLKSHAQDPLFVQLHQMNSFAAAASFVIHFRHAAVSPTDGEVVAASAAANVASSVAGNASVAAVVAHAAAGTEHPSSTFLDRSTQHGFPTVGLVACILARGFLSGSVLKQLDAIAKGLIDIAAIVICTVLQVCLGGAAIDSVAIGI